MIKLIANDYWMELKSMVKGRKKSEWALDIWLIFYFALILPGLFVDERWVAWNHNLWTNIFWIILWTGFTLCRYYQNRPGKIFYLLPVTEKDRKSYLLTGYWFRVFFFTVLLGCYLFLWTVVKKMSFLWAGYCLFHCFLMMCMVNTDIGNMKNTVFIRDSLYMANTVSIRGSAGSLCWSIMSYGVIFVSVIMLYRASPGYKVWGNTEYWTVGSKEMMMLFIELFFAAAAGFFYWRRVFRDLCGETPGNGQ